MTPEDRMKQYHGTFDGVDIEQISEAITALIGLFEWIKDAAIDLETAAPDTGQPYYMTCFASGGINIARELDNTLNRKIKEAETAEQHGRGDSHE